MSYNTPVYVEQGGTRQIVGSGGSIHVASGGIINVATGGSIRFGGAGAALGNIQFGSVVLTNGGSATVGVGFPILGVAPIIVGLDGSISGVAVNTSLYSSGSAILYGMSGTLATTTQRGTVGYTIFG